MSPDLSSLASDYDIVGELDGTDGARRYVGTRKGDISKRRDDQPGVLITLFTTPEGDEGNALSHLAADTQLLARMAHRRLIPVIEGRWLGDDSFAVVTRRVTDPSLAQRLATGESFTTPRIAAILRDVNGLLDWARGQQIVHRSVTPENIFLEPKTDRVRVSFAIAPIRRIRHSAEDDDARTIARLATAMLTGEQDPKSYAGKSLAELRPGLPERLQEATDTLLSEKHAGTPSDVAAYLALIGMADPLAAGESEAGRIRAEILEEQRVEREAIATDRFNFDRMMEQEREKLAADRAELEKAVAEERARLERAATEERARLQRALEEERAALVAKREELERTVAEQRTEMERAAAADRRQIERLREELKRAGELEIEKKRQTALEDITDEESSLDRKELAQPSFLAPVLAPLEAVEFDDDSPLLSDDAIDLGPPRELDETLDEVSASSKPVGPTTRQRWAIVSAAVVAILAVIGISAAVIARHGPLPASATTSATSAGEAATPIAPARVVAPPAAVPASAPTRADSLATGGPAADSVTTLAALRWMDSVRTAHPLQAPPPVAPPPVASSSSTPASPSQPPQSRAARDTLPQKVIQSVTDSIFDFRRATPAKRDSNVRGDTAGRPVIPRPR
jgi:hypothetical protein